jgi:hypothetical protein
MFDFHQNKLEINSMSWYLRKLKVNLFRNSYLIISLLNILHLNNIKLIYILNLYLFSFLGTVSSKNRIYFT